MNSLERAEREAKEEAAKEARLARMQQRFSVTSNVFDEPPPPPAAAPPKPESPLSSCFLLAVKKCAGVNVEESAPQTPQAKRASSRGSVQEGLRQFGQDLETDLTAKQIRVKKTSQAVQDNFGKVAAFVPIDLATKKGNEESFKVRSEMWQLLCSQVEAGMGTPTEEQLAALWRKYDGNSDGVLSLAELRLVLTDYAAAMHARLSESLPILQRRLEQARGKLDPFVEMMGAAFVSECEAQLGLYRAQAEGRITQEAIGAALGKLDTSHDGRITRDEFMSNATPVFFSGLLETMTNEAMLA